VEQVARSARLLRFAVYEIDLDAGELRKSGRKVSLQEQPFQVLALLLSHPNQLVTRDELQKRLWPADTFVDFDLGLNTAIKKIRAALSDSPDNPKFVETLPRRGYRFICPVEEVLVSATPAASENLAASSAHTQSGSMVSENSIGTSKPSHAWIRLALGSLAFVTLAAGLSFYKLRNGTTHAPRTSKELEKLGDRGTKLNAAWESYLNGRNFLQAAGGPDQSDNAIQAFELAVKADPLYALAYGGLGEAYIRKYKATGQEEWKVRAQAGCDRAVELDTTRPAGRLCQGTLDNATGDYKQAVKDFSAGIEIDPLNVRAYQGRARAYKGLDEVAEAEKDYLKAIEIDPRNWRSHSALAKLYFDDTRYNEAVQKYEAAIRLKPDDSGLHSSLGSAYMQMGQYDRAVPELEHAIELQATFQAYEDLGLSFLNKRQYAKAINQYKAAIALDDPQDYLGYGALARAYYWAGQRELARENYERAIVLAKQKLIVNPDDADVHLMLSVYYAMLRQEKDAHSHLDRAWQLMPDGPEVDFWAGVVHLQLDNRIHALAWLRRARSLNYSFAEMNAAPELDRLRADPEFRQFLSAGSNSVGARIDPELTRRTK
jgi:tetratricopeptide (TPR) repeat protein